MHFNNRELNGATYQWNFELLFSFSHKKSDCVTHFMVQITLRYDNLLKFSELLKCERTYRTSGKIKWKTQIKTPPIASHNSGFTSRRIILIFLLKYFIYDFHYDDITVFIERPFLQIRFYSNFENFNTKTFTYLLFSCTRHEMYMKECSNIENLFLIMSENVAITLKTRIENYFLTEVNMLNNP